MIFLHNRVQLTMTPRIIIIQLSLKKIYYQPKIILFVPVYDKKVKIFQQKNNTESKTQPMSSSKIKLKVEHKKHAKQQKQKPSQQKQKPKQEKATIKQEKSGKKLGKSKSKQKVQKKIVQQQSDEQDQKLEKSKSKDKKLQKSPNKKDKKEGKSDKKDKKDKKQGTKQDKKNKKKKDKDQKQGKKDKKDKKDKKNKKGKNDSEDQQDDPKEKSKKKGSHDKDKQLQTISNINKHSDKAKLTIGQLIQLYKDVSYDIFVNHGHNPEKEKQIEEQLERLEKQKDKRRNKIQQLNKQAEQRKKQKQQKLQQRIKIKQEKLLDKRKQNISLKLQNLSQAAKKRKQDHEQFKQYATQRKRNHIPRYKKYEQQFKEFEQVIKQEHDQIIQQRKLKVAPLDYEQLSKFQEQYQQQKLQAIQHGQRKLQLQKQIISQQNQWMRKLYKGSASKVVAQQATKNFTQEQYLTAKQKLQRTRQYGKLIKSQFVEVKDNQNQEQHTEATPYESEEMRFHEKYVQGKCLGLVPEKRVKPLTNQQKQKLGVQYLQYIRKLPRKGINSSEISKTINVNQSRTSQKIGKTYIMKRASNPYYHVQRSGTSFDAKNHKQIELAIEQVKSKDASTSLQQKALSHLQYSDVTDLQKRHLNVNKRLVGDINHKLDILKKLVD